MATINLSGSTNTNTEVSGVVVSLTPVVDIQVVTEPQPIINTTTAPTITAEAITIQQDTVTPLFPSATQLTGLNNLPDVDPTGLEDHSILMYDAPNELWKPTRTIEHHVINGGQY